MFAEKDHPIENPRKTIPEPPTKKRRKLELSAHQEEDSGSDYVPSERDYNTESDQEPEPEPESEPEPDPEPEPEYETDNEQETEEPGTRRRKTDFPFENDEGKLKLIISRLKKAKPKDLETYAEYLPEPNSDATNYLTSEEIKDYYDGLIKKLLSKIQEVEQEKRLILTRNEKLKRLYANSNTEKFTYKMKMPNAKRQRPNFLCPLPYCAGHAMNMRQHRIMAHPEIKDEEDREFFEDLFTEMKRSVQEKVSQLPVQTLTRNQALLLKMNLLSKKTVNPDEPPAQDQAPLPPTTTENQPEPEKPTTYPAPTARITPKDVRREA